MIRACHWPWRPNRLSLHVADTAQSGQSLLEGMLALMLLASVWIAVGWLGRLQDIALATQHASSRLAFAATRHEHNGMPDRIREQFFQGPAQQWADRSGRPLLAATAEKVPISLDRSAFLPASAQPGGAGLVAAQLRQDWGMHDSGVLNARVTSQPSPTTHLVGKAGVLDLHIFDLAYPRLSRHTAILVGAGHAANDASVQHTLPNSGLAWANAVEQSQAAGRKVADIMNAVDAGWHRPEPNFDWLTPWTALIPQHHLSRPGVKHEN